MVVVRTDAELVAAIADADRGAMRELYERHAPWVTSRLRRRCADPELVAEAVQDTFVAVWRGARRWDGRGEPAAWIWGIAIRRLIGVLRTRRRWMPAVRGGERDDVVVAAEETALLGVEHGDLGRALDRLAPELRAVIQATVIDGLTTREAGRLLHIPAGTVKTRVRRAKQELRGALT
jgi:RNA polymerase sigma-70 factor (ECF subfamily)